MKHLHKFNESINNTIIDIDYIEDCFVELKDLGIFDLVFNYHRSNSDRCTIKVKTGKTNIETLSDIYKKTKNKLKIIEEIEYSFEKVKIKYPYMQYIIYEEKKNIKIEFALDTCDAVIIYPNDWKNI